MFIRIVLIAKYPHHLDEGDFRQCIGTFDNPDFQKVPARIIDTVTDTSVQALGRHHDDRPLVCQRFEGGYPIGTYVAEPGTGNHKPVYLTRLREC